MNDCDRLIALNYQGNSSRPNRQHWQGPIEILTQLLPRQRHKKRATNRHKPPK